MEFGNQEESFVLVDDAPPALAARDLGSGQFFRANAALLEVPGEGLFWIDGQEQLWFEPTNDQARVVDPAAIFGTGDRRFELFMPFSHEETASLSAGFSIETVRLFLEPDRRLELRSANRRRTLEWQWHHRLLDVLARARLADERLPIEDAGWRSVDWIEAKTGFTTGVLNTATHSVRRGLAEAELEGAARIIESRRGARRIGLESSRLEL
jgi:hypothetical protein